MKVTATERTPEAQAKIDAMWRMCPYCFSPPGTYCASEFGTTLYRPHKDRFKSQFPRSQPPTQEDV